MGGRFGRNRNVPTNDPFYNAVPPSGTLLPPLQGQITSYPPGAPGLATYDPNAEYGYNEVYVPTIENYGTRRQPNLPNNYGGRYAQGLNQMPGIGPWNYGNYYLGNTTMQIMPLMLNKVHQYGMMQANAALAGSGLFGSMPMNLCCPSLNYGMSMPMSSPIMAASATPLPIAFNPLVQGMYPMASMSPVNWMAPSSFMSALMSGPMPYRPPGYDFPSNVGMVMTIPYGTPNPFLSSPSFGGTSWSCCCWSTMPSTSMPSYYPPAMPAVPASVSALPQLSAPMAASVAPLASYQGGINQAFAAPSHVMASSEVKPAPTSAMASQPPIPVYKAAINSSDLANTTTPINPTPSQAKYPVHRSPSQASAPGGWRRFLPSIPGFPRRSSYSFTESQQYPPRREPILPPIREGVLISDSGWLPKNAAYETRSPLVKSKRAHRALYTTDHGRSTLHSSGHRVEFFPHVRRRKKGTDQNQSSSSVSEYDCAICQQNHDKRRLRDYFDASTVSSLLSSSKRSKRRRHKKHRRHSSKESNSSRHRRRQLKHQPVADDRADQVEEKQSLGSIKSPSPTLPRRSPIQQKPPQRHMENFQDIGEEQEEGDEEEEDQDENDYTDDDDDDEEEEDSTTQPTSV